MEFKSINQLKSLIDENKISVKEIAQTYIKKIKEKKDLNIFIYFEYYPNWILMFTMHSTLIVSP